MSRGDAAVVDAQIAALYAAQERRIILTTMEQMSRVYGAAR